jgi:hypothetical protein
MAKYEGGANKKGMGLGKFLGSVLVFLVASLAAWCIFAGLIGAALHLTVWTLEALQ